MTCTKQSLLAIALSVFGSVAIAEETRCLALNIYFESRGEPEEGQIAVAHVTLNRVQNSRFPDTICAVVYQPKQFSWTHIRRSHTPSNRAAWKQSKRIAETAIKWYAVGEDFSDGALFFHADYVNPYWSKHFTKTVQIGRHIFYK
jgi:N-acetylmuramoyl-L-alanine amidase